ncbi:MAG: DsbA family protein [Pseudomonadota bacterium]
MAQLLPAFAERYDVELKPHIVSPPPDWAAPDRARLDAYARKDAARLAERAHLTYSDPSRQPSPDQIQAANQALVEAVDRGTFLDEAYAIGQQVWGNPDALMTDAINTQIQSQLEAATARRDALGHYLGGTVYYAGEWYWGPDRLHYLERRLADLGASRADVGVFLFPPHSVDMAALETANSEDLELHWYLSFRSPYTGIVADRIKKIADMYGAELKLRYVLPMVMRGMQVPRKKGFYIMKDTVREAERQGISFGNSVDPVGAPVERGYAILHEAIKHGKGYDFARSFLAGVWSQGLDAGSDRGLKTITERAGLPWTEMKPLIGRDHWQATADANREEMFEYGIWGVPSFRVGDVTAWGQDRLWVIEDALAAQTEQIGEE